MFAQFSKSSSTAYLKKLQHVQCYPELIKSIELHLNSKAVCNLYQTNPKMCFDIGIVTGGPNEVLIVTGMFQVVTVGIDV